MGSFLLVVTSRMGVRTLQGRSRCDRCGTQIEVRDLVPIWSYLRLRGRCRSCESRIGKTALWVEVVMGLLFGIQGLVSPDPVTLVFGCIVISICAVLTIYDARSHFLPLDYLIALLCIGVIYRFVALPELGIVHTVMGYVYLAIPALLLFTIVALSRGRAMGLGDPLLLLGLSVVIGTWQGALFTLLFSTWIGLGYACVLMWKDYHSGKSQRLSRPIAYGPCLIAGFVITWWLSLQGMLIFV